MNGLDELLLECDAHGIRLSPDGDEGLTIDAPEDALAPDLIERMKVHKAELLAILRPRTDGSAIDLTDQAGETDEAIAPPDPCPECGSLELWETLTGRWRCLKCDPPTIARRLRQRAARLRSKRPVEATGR